MLNFNLDYTQLFSFGCHLGHNRANILFTTAWQILAFRQQISIIDLFKTIIAFRVAFAFINNSLALSAPIWFVMLDKVFERYTKAAATVCGEFSITKRWIRGAITNYPYVFYAYRRICNLPKAGFSAKQARWASNYSNWLFSRISWPRLLILPCLFLSYTVSQEAYILSIPTISITDTNTYTQATTLAIPGNDESTLSFVLYNELFCSFILSRKFTVLTSWFTSIRDFKRNISFSEWISRGAYNKGRTSLFNFAFFRPDAVKQFNRSAGLFVSKNYWKSTFLGRLDLFTDAKIFPDASLLALRFLVRRLRYFSLSKFHFFTLYNTFYPVYRKKYFKLNIIKQKFFFRSFLYQRFFRRAYYLTIVRIRHLAWNPVIRNIAQFFYFTVFTKFFDIRKANPRKSRFWLLFGKFFGIRPYMLPIPLFSPIFRRKFVKLGHPLPERIDTYLNVNAKLNLRPQLSVFRTNYTIFPKAVSANFWHNSFFSGTPVEKLKPALGSVTFIGWERRHTFYSYYNLGQTIITVPGRFLCHFKPGFFWIWD